MSNGVLTVRGYGVRLAVERGHLVVEDGIGADRRRLRISRIETQLHRLVLIGHTGTVTLDALRWLADVHCSFIHLDADGKLLGVASRAGRDDAGLRRAQANAVHSPTGLDAARLLLGAKLNGQADLLETVLGAHHESEAVLEAASILRQVPTLDAMRAIEARVAILYWSRWRDVAVRFVKIREHRVPAHWLRFGVRRSVLSGRNRHAVNPANAILNYLSAIGEAEARIALLAAGLDPGVGVVHADSMNRDSMALDLLEAVRPAIEGYALRLMAARTFDVSDFFETRTGNCRLMPTVTAELAETGPRWAHILSTIVPKVARLLERSSLMKESASSELRSDRLFASLPRLLQVNPSAARRVGKARGWMPVNLAPKARVCRECGADGLRDRNVYCDVCIVKFNGFKSAHAVREAEGWSFSATTRRRMGRARSERIARMKTWAARHEATPNPQVFVANIWPTLADVTSAAMRKHTGLSYAYCVRILRGRAVPHPMHWKAIQELARKKS